MMSVLNEDSRNYSLDITIPEFEALDKVDYLDVVLPALEKLGADLIEYDGHFGPHVYFTAESENAPIIQAKIMEFCK